VAYEFRLPDLGEGLTEAEIARWLVVEGARVEEDQPLVEVQTDKTTVEIPSPRAGTVLKVLVAEGDVAPVGAVLVVIGEEGEHLLRAVAAPATAAVPISRNCRRVTSFTEGPRVGRVCLSYDTTSRRTARHDGLVGSVSSVSAALAAGTVLE